MYKRESGIELQLFEKMIKYTLYLMGIVAISFLGIAGYIYFIEVIVGVPIV